MEEMIAMKEEIEGTNLKIQTSKYYIVKVPKNMVRILRCVTKYAKREKIHQHEHEFCVKYELSNEIWHHYSIKQRYSQKADHNLP